jgi:exosome complex component RRP43
MIFLKGLEVLFSASVLDLEELCIKPNESAWVIFADIICLEYDGAILDACLAALMLALGNGKGF